MNRRGFLSLLGTAAAGFALDPERLLWVPGQKTIFTFNGAPFVFDEHCPSNRIHAVPPNIGQIVATAWEAVIREHPLDFSDYWLIRGIDTQG